MSRWARVESLPFEVVRQGARLTGRVTDRGLDEDGDKRFEKIVFDVEVEVQDEGEYDVSLGIAEQGSPEGLTGGGGYQSAQLGPGLHTVSVAVDVDDLHELGHSSPYEIRRLWLNNRSERSATVSQLESAGVTRRYDAAELRKPRMAVDRSISDRGVDEDGDGLFDWLVVSVPFEVRRGSGNCSWEAALATLPGETIHTAFGSGKFPFEQNVAELKFDGRRIRSAGVSGPYRVRDFRIRCIVHDIDVASLGTTQAYSVSQFGGVQGSITEISHRVVHRGEKVLVGVEGARTNFQPSRSSVTITPPLRVDSVAVTEPTYLRFYLSVEGDTPLGPRTITVTTGDEVVRLENAFTVTDAPPPEPEYVEETAAAESVEETPPQDYAKLTGRFAERLIDKNRDGLAEAFALDVEVAVERAGRFRVSARVASWEQQPWPSSLGFDLAPGTHWVEIVIPDKRLYRFGESFQFTIDELKLGLVGDYRQVEIGKIANVGQTARYELSRFELPLFAFTGEPTEQAVDDNGDGLYDRLVVTAPFEKRRPNPPNSERWAGSLMGANGKRIDFSSRPGPFAPGVNLLTLEFDGAAIRKANMDGPFFVREVGVGGWSDSASIEQLIETRPYRAEPFRGQPRLLPLKPAVAWQGETVTVEIRGSATSFSQGETQVAAGEAVAVETEIVPDPELLRATFRVDPTAAPGRRTVTVTTGGETATLAEAFRVLGPGETGHEPPPRKAPPKGKIVHELRDRGVDDDGNGRFERFVIEVDAEFEEPGEYSVVFYLQHSGGAMESLADSRKADAGRQTFRVSFPAHRLHLAPEQTPYTVQQVMLRGGSGRGTVPMDRFKADWKTQQYDVADFEPARLTVSQATERALDDDGDGLFDRLVVTVPVEVRRETDSAAQYSWALGLRDGNGNYIHVVRARAC